MIRKHSFCGVGAGFAASALALAISAQAFAGTVTTDGTDLIVKTKGGLEVTTVDKQYGFKLGGVIQADFDQFEGFYTANNKSANEAYFRRAILELSGNYQDWKYIFAYDFANGQANNGAGGPNTTNGSNSTNWDKAAIIYTGFAPINIQVGRFDPDFGLQHATSSKWTVFKERAVIYDLAPWVNNKQDDMGIMVNGTAGGNIYGSAGLYQQETNDGSNESTSGMDVNAFVARGVFAPIISETEVLHFGVDFAQKTYDDDRFLGGISSNLGVRGIGEDNTNNTPTPTLARTNSTRFYGQDRVYGLEFAYMTGPLSVEAEYLTRELEGLNANGNRTADGYYGQIAYSLTGESRSYKIDGAAFGQLKPLNKKTGAWEVFYRYENLAVNDDDNLQGSVINTADAIDNSSANVNILGVNWYANEAVKVSLDYEYVSTDSDTLELQAGLNPNNSTNTTLGAREALGANDKNGSAISARLQYVF